MRETINEVLAANNIDRHQFLARFDLMKVMIRLNPGILLGLKRQAGKTRCLLELIHEDYAGEAILFTVSAPSARYALSMWATLYHGRKAPVIVYEIDQLRGVKKLPIFVDEWFSLDVATQRRLISMDGIMARIGTEL